MNNLETPKPNEALDLFLPMLYVAWADATLTPSEIQNIRSLIDRSSWLSNEEIEMIKGYLDPAHPPSPAQMKGWLSQIKNSAANIPDNTKGSLVELGITIASLSRLQQPETLEAIRNSLKEIESALGVLGSESKRFLLKQDTDTITQNLGTIGSFDTVKMNKLLDGDQRDLIMKVKSILCDPAFNYYKGESKDAYREQVLKWCRLLADQGYGARAYPKSVGGSDDMAGYFAIMETLSYHDLSLVIKFGVQFGLFGMSILFLGTEKHHQKYLKEIGSLALPGSFAMTETGHGSNVKGIETTATFDNSNSTFTIHTPSDNARKDYIGNAACHAQKATVFAKLMIDGVDYGVNAFVVPLRDSKGETLPGIRIEDCGYKMGLNGVDNGRIWFDHVVIPKENMLDRYAWVNEDGTFESPITSDSRRFFTMLGTLVGGRIGIPRSGLSAAKSGLTIAIKYADKRKQFGPENGEEASILNYRTHQRRLMPLLANTYAFHFGLQYLTERFLNRSEEDMREIEALAAGLKAMATWNTTETLQTCREACGGKGYLIENRIGILKNDTEIYTTFEGDNTVLMQLVAKGRLTEFRQEFHDINLFGILNYVKDQAKTALLEMNPITTRKTDEAHLQDSTFHLEAFRYRERDILTSAAKRLKKHLVAGMDSFDAFNQCQYHMLNVGKAYTERVVLEQFVTQVNQTADPGLQAVLKKLCDLFALNQIEKNKGWYLEHGYMEGTKTKAIRRLVNKLCWEVRQEAVPLVEAFQIPESCLGAPIAREG